MDYGKVLKRSWGAVWSLKFLWFFGFLLAMTTTASFGWSLLSADDQGLDAGLTFQLEENRVIRIIGEGIVVDFTGPGEPQVRLTDANLRGIEELREGIDGLRLSDLWTVLIFAGIELLLLLFIRALLRYSSESAVIHSVDEYEEAGTKVGFGRAFRLGWSRTAVRLFGIDLLIYLTVALFAVGAFLMALGPLLLAIGSGREWAMILAAGLTFMLLAGWTFLLVIALLGSSLIRQVSWRACGVEGLGVLASVSRGFAHLRNDFANLMVAWLMWVGVGLGWLLLLIPIIVLLFPVILVSIIAGAFIGFVPAVITWAIASLFVNGFTAFVLGVLVGIPFFVLVALAPMFFLGGLVRLFQSNIWTLTFGELPPVPQPVPAESPDFLEPELEALPTG